MSRRALSLSKSKKETSLRVYDLMSRRALSLSKSKKETSLKVSDRESKAKGPEFIDGQSS